MFVMRKKMEEIQRPLYLLINRKIRGWTLEQLMGVLLELSMLREEGD
jgi:hypothetical protein